MATAFSAGQRKQYEEQGFILLRQVFSPARIQSLVDAIERLIDRALAGRVTIPWIGESANRAPERLSGLLNPDRYDPAFANWLEEDVLPLIESLLQSPVRHSLFGMLAGGGGKAYRQAWHHDLATPDMLHPAVIFNPEPFWFTQFNAPLKPHDRFLQIIPASHNRRATLAEIDAYQKDPQGDITGQMTVEMEPGDIAFYNANLWHRGWNPDGQMRWTMHSAYWRPDFPVMAHDAGQRETLQTPGHLDRFPKRVYATLMRYLQAYPQDQPRKLPEVIQSRMAACGPA
jgi:Phytanoyl-CoA dioxygenase (PhyH)